MSHLRFTPAEYNAIARVCRPLDLDKFALRTFHNVLVASLFATSPTLAKRVGRFESSEVRLLHAQLRTEAKGARPPLYTPDERRTLAEACSLVPSSARFAHAVRPTVLRRLRATAPALARKLSRMSLTRFVCVLEQIQEEKSA